MDIGGGAIWAGTWREASIYNMKQQTFELTDNVTYTKGINKFTFGTHNEFYNLTYGFVNSWNGRWEYSNLNSFLADQPSRIRGAYTIDPTQHPNTRESLYNNSPNPYKVALLSAYAQDEVTVSRTFKITPGLRVDYPKLANDIPVDADFAKAASNTLNATYSSTPFNAFTNKWLGTATLSPRIGFNWDVKGNQKPTLGGSWMWNAKNTTSLNFFYSGQSGNPYSVVYNSSGAPFGNAANANLPYIPKDQTDIRLVDKGTYTAAQQWQDLNNLIENDKYLKTRRGQYAERNGLRTPWNHELDMKLMHTFNLSTTNKQHTLAISLDVFNVLNLLNNDWGHITFVTNVNNYTVNMLNFVGYATDVNGNPIAGSTTAVGKPSSGYIPTFTYNKPTGLGGHYYTVDPINSRWQGQLGIKYSF